MHLFLYCGLSLSLFVGVYYILNRQITKRQLVAELQQVKEQLQREKLERERLEQALQQSEERYQLANCCSDVYEELRLRKQAEEALQQSESTLRSFFDSASMMMGIVELVDDDILHISDNVTTAKLFGLTPEAMQNRLASEMGVPPKYLREWIEYYREAERTRAPVRFEYFHDTAQGQRCLSATVCPIVLSPSNRSRFAYVVEDISDRKQAQKALQESQAQLQAILDNSPTIIYLIDSQNRYLLINRRHENLFNVTKEGILGKNIYEVWPYEIAEEFATNNRKVLESGIPIEVEEVAPLEDELRTYITVKFPLHDANGCPYAVCGISTDITERKQAERRWHSFLENVRLAVVGLDKNGKLNYVNPYFIELVGYTKAEVIGQDWFETFFPLHQRKRLQNTYLELLENEFYTHNQNVILTKSGEERVIAWNNTLLKDLQGNAIGTLSIGEDITERQVIERMKDEFISIVSHEIRTPLASIHGAL
ncbi:MAG TPA: PAS domain S-box protein, partial [Oculatellaceae cyanobacterium]